MNQRPAIDEAFDIAQEILGYPCPCERCSNDDGAAKAEGIAELAFDLAGISPASKISSPTESKL